MEQPASVRAGGPFERLAEVLGRARPGALVVAGFGLTLAAGFFDYLTGPQLGALTFYLLPVALVAWAGERWQALACGVLAAALWAVAEAVNGRPYDSSWVFLWNSLTRLVVFLIIAALLHPRGSRGDPDAVEAAGVACPHCGSDETLTLHVGLVCKSCKRLS